MNMDEGSALTISARMFVGNQDGRQGILYMYLFTFLRLTLVDLKDNHCKEQDIWHSLYG